MPTDGEVERTKRRDYWWASIDKTRTNRCWCNYEMAVRNAGGYSGVNRSIILRRSLRGVMQNSRPPPPPPLPEALFSLLRTAGWFHLRFNAFQMIRGSPGIITMKWLSPGCAPRFMLAASQSLFVDRLFPLPSAKIDRRSSATLSCRRATMTDGSYRNIGGHRDFENERWKMKPR